MNNFATKNSDLTRAEEDIVKIKEDVKKVPLGLKAFANVKIHANIQDIKGVDILDTNEFILFNSQADSGLNIFDSSESARGISLFKILNKTRTSGGERLLRVWLRQPLTNKEKICERLNMVEQLLNASGARKTLHESILRRIPDFQSIGLKVKDKKAQLGDLYKGYTGIREVKKMVELLENEDDLNSDLFKENFVKPLTNKSNGFGKYLDLIDSTLDFDSLNDGKYMVNPNFDNELQSLKSELDEVKEEIENSLKKVVASTGLDKKAVKLETSAQHGYTFRVTMKDEKIIRKKSGIFIVDTTKGGVRFRNHQLEQHNKKFLELSSKYDEQQSYVVSEILTIAEGYVDLFCQLGSLTSYLDCLVSFAIATDQAPIPYVKPEVVERSEGILELEQARHPCLEIMDGMCFIPNDVSFSKKDRGFCIITGPNLGGKSTYLRSVALNVLMAQVGCFVACKKAKIFPVDRILVRIGAGDCQLQGVSTFMAEMLESSYIVRSATEHSLILIDELGRGTSTYDGLGLAWAISRHIAAEVKAFSLFATHFHEITKLADEIPTVFNCYVDAIAKDNEFTLLYNVKAGSSAKSFGIEVAKLAGFPGEVVANAKKYLEESELPLLRSNGGLDAQQVSEFLSQYKDESIDKKRKGELLHEMKAKVAKVSSS